MPSGDVKLRGCGNYDAWMFDLEVREDLTEEQRSMLFSPPMNLNTGDAGYAKQYKDRSHTYSVLVDSLDDRIFSGLVAHGQLRCDESPWDLFATLEEYCDPSPSFAASLVRLLQEKRINEFATPGEFATYVDFIRLCVEGDDYSMALTCILFDTVKKTNPEVTDFILPISNAMGWTQLLEQVRELVNHKKRLFGERTVYAGECSGRDDSDTEDGEGF